MKYLIVFVIFTVSFIFSDIYAKEKRTKNSNGSLNLRSFTFNAFISPSRINNSDKREKKGRKESRAESARTFKKSDNSTSSQGAFSNKKVSLLMSSIQSLMYAPDYVTDAVALEPDIVGRPLPYPNPFSLKQDIRNVGYLGTMIGYELTVDMEIKLIVYDIFGHKILERIFEAGESPGGKAGWNEVPFNLDSVNGFDLSSSVYFFILIHKNEVLGKGKMAIVP